MATEQQRRDIRQELTDELVRLVEEGVAPWQKPWDPTAAAAAFQLPINPVTGKTYRGGNSIQLIIAASKIGRSEDPRWCTYKQAQAQGWQVKKGAKAQTIQYWKWEREETRQSPVTGNSETVSVKLDSPSAFYASVFHASQIEGIGIYEPPPMAKERWEIVALAEEIIEKSGSRIIHDQLDRAFYAPHLDEIHLPPRAAFETQLDYYEVLLHEIGHWTGHESRLNRDLSGGFGSPRYAREELRAQLASLFLSAEIGIPYNPQRHAAYQANWVEALKNDKNEIYQAASQAHQIAEYVIGLSKTFTLSKSLDVNVMQQPSESNDVQGYGVRPNKENIMAQQNVNPNKFGQVAEALNFISSSTGRDEWVKIAMAIKSEFSGDDGFSLFDSWSQSGDNYKASSAVSTWQSIKAEGGITISTLFNAAIQGGWKPPEATQESIRQPKPEFTSGPKDDTTSQNEKALKLAKQEQTAAQALELWESGTPDTITPYLERKGVDSHGLRAMPNGILLVPLVDEDGKLWNLQRILPNQPENADTDKFYLKDGRKSGLFHVIGDIQENSQILFAEGYATGASLHEATKNPVVITFDSGNLVRVAKLFREFYPSRPMVVCGDDDVANTHNTGRKKALEAGSAIGSPVIFPQAEGFSGKDFNDLIAQYGRDVGGQQINRLLNLANSNVSQSLMPSPPDQVVQMDEPHQQPAEQATSSPIPTPGSVDSEDDIGASENFETEAQPAFINTVENEDISPALAPMEDGRSLLDKVTASLKDQFLFADGKFYFRDKNTTLAFVDDGKTFKTQHSHPEVVQAIVALAHAKGWKQLHINGSLDFMRKTWLEASLLGLNVSGYVPDPLDHAKLKERRAVMATDMADKPSANLNSVTTSDRSLDIQSVSNMAASVQRESILQAQIREQLKATGVKDEKALDTTIASVSDLLKTPRVYVGVLLEHGDAPYKFNKNEKRHNYFAKLKSADGEQTIWGVDIKRAFEENAPRIGETILLAHQGSQPVTVSVDLTDPKGQVVGQEKITTERNIWIAESLQKLHEEAQVGVVISRQEGAQPASTDLNTQAMTQNKGLEIVARAMAINQVPKDIATSSIAALAESLQTTHQPQSKVMHVRFEQASSQKQRLSQTL